MSEKLTYASYLKVDKIINSQELESEKDGNRQHDEHLFITIHQVYELWFKQILVELDSVRQLFHDANWNKPGKELFLIIKRFERVTLILRLIADQFPILQTMTPNDFLEFRKYLKTGSGFESLQFRKLENTLGIKDVLREKYGQDHYTKVFNKKELDDLEKTKAKPSLFDIVESWLERIPELEADSFNFQKKYKDSVDSKLQEGRKSAEGETDAKEKEKKLKACKSEEDTFSSLIDQTQHDDLKGRGDRRFSHKAMFGALMVFQYREEPKFQQSFQVLSLLLDIDGLMMRWRSNHVTMVHRMIGGKAGTGGSSGKEYLASTINDHYKVFVDLFNLPTFLLTRDQIMPYE